MLALSPHEEEEKRLKTLESHSGKTSGRGEYDKNTLRTGDLPDQSTHPRGKKPPHTSSAANGVSASESAEGAMVLSLWGEKIRKGGVEGPILKIPAVGKPLARRSIAGGSTARDLFNPIILLPPINGNKKRRLNRSSKTS